MVSERWTVHWGQPWPEVQHVVGLYDALQVKITHSTLFYRPTGWDGVSATEFFPHSTANISDVGGFGGPVVPWTGTDRIPDFHRSPQTSGGLHPGSFTLSRVPL